MVVDGSLSLSGMARGSSGSCYRLWSPGAYPLRVEPRTVSQVRNEPAWISCCRAGYA